MTCLKLSSAGLRTPRRKPLTISNSAGRYSSGVISKLNRSLSPISSFVMGGQFSVITVKLEVILKAVSSLWVGHHVVECRPPSCGMLSIFTWNTHLADNQQTMPPGDLRIKLLRNYTFDNRLLAFFYLGSSLLTIKLNRSLSFNAFFQVGDYSLLLWHK